jgi:hypothetical protein
VGIKTKNLIIYDVLEYLMGFLLKNQPLIQEMKDSINNMMDVKPFPIKRIF